MLPPTGVKNEFLKEHLSASDLIELSNGISLFRKQIRESFRRYGWS